MAEVQFTDDARDIMEQFVASFPEAIKGTYKTKVLKGVEYQLLKKGLAEASKDILIDALYEVFPKSFDPLLLHLHYHSIALMKTLRQNLLLWQEVSVALFRSE